MLIFVYFVFQGSPGLSGSPGHPGDEGGPVSSNVLLYLESCCLYRTDSVTVKII